MIQLKIDDCPADLSSQEWDRSRVGEVVHSVYEEMPKNRIITKILVNGMPLTKENHDRELSVEEDAQIEIQTADRVFWEMNGVENSLSILERVQTSLIRTAELFRMEDKVRANRFFAQCIESLEKFLDSITVTRLACKLNFSSILVEGTPLSKTEETLPLILRSVLESQEKSNFEELADKIEYELITNLYNWKTGLQSLLRSMHSNS